MSLKKTIDTTELINLNLEKVSNNINEKLIEKGVAAVNSLNEVPDKLDEMVVPFKKIVILSPNIVIPFNTSGNTTETFTRTIPLNLSFKPTYVFVEVIPPGDIINNGIHIFGGTIKSSYGDGYHTRGKILTITKESVKVSIQTINWSGAGGTKSSISRVWAIE